MYDKVQYSSAALAGYHTFVAQFIPVQVIKTLIFPSIVQSKTLSTVGNQQIDCLMINVDYHLGAIS